MKHGCTADRAERGTGPMKKDVSTSALALSVVLAIFGFCLTSHTQFGHAIDFVLVFEAGFLGAFLVQRIMARR
jgi:hypothetical protein